MRTSTSSGARWGIGTRSILRSSLPYKTAAVICRATPLLLPVSRKPRLHDDFERASRRRRGQLDCLANLRQSQAVGNQIVERKLPGKNEFRRFVLQFHVG